MSSALGDKLKVPFLTILFFFVCLYVFVAFFGPVMLANITNDSNLFTIDGTGSASAVPTAATVTIGITKISTTVQDGQRQVNTVANQLTADFLKLGINKTDIKTTNYFVNPVPSKGTYPMETYPNGGTGSNIITLPIRTPLAGDNYQVTENLVVKTNTTELANKVIDISTKDGVNVIGGIQFTFSDNEQSKLEDEARTKAISDAKRKAEKIAQESGLRLGKLVNVTENNPQPVFNSFAKTAVAPSSTNLQPGQNQVTVNVNLSYQTL